MFDPLMRALSRRDLDNAFLPTKVPPLGRRQPWFSDIAAYVRRLNDAISGKTFDGIRSNYFPRLPILLRERLISTLTGLEAEAVGLGQSIELNHFRKARRDPRARSEEELAVWRSEAYTRWKMLLTELMAEVEAYWKAERRKAGSRL